ncbi:MAG: hypothetical protein ACF8R7_03715 [Phycisphaerales bacterium JB039]
MKTRVCFIAALAGFAAAAQGQYSSDFEALTASATGEVLTGQDAYYIPAGTVSVDFLAYTYAGNPYSIPANPEGGDQFVAGEGPAGGAFARAQRDMTWPEGIVTVSYDICAAYNDPGGVVPGNNVGSFSIQPYPGSASAIVLFSWTDTAARTWQIGFLGYTAAGATAAQPGVIPGPEWQGLSLLNWYRVSQTIDFDANQIVCATITDLSTGASASYDLVDVYLESGSAGTAVHPTGFRLFGGGGVAGNVTAWDNLSIDVGDPCPAPCYADCDGNGILDFFDFLCFQNAFATGDPYADCDGNTILDFFDFLCFQNEFAVGCP